MSEFLTKGDDHSARAPDIPAIVDEGDAAQARRWRNWLATSLAVTAALTAVVYAGIVLIDPYATGRLTPIERVDVATSNMRFGLAARARDPQFDTGIIGNSHAILIDPARLSDATHLHVVQLATMATGPREQFVVARAFLRNHRKAAGLIVVLDDLSCLTTEMSFPTFGEFPTFLFEGSDLDYLRGIYSLEALQAAAKRVSMILGLAAAPQRPDGFAPALFPPAMRPEFLLRLASLRHPTEGPVPGTPLPALTRLEALVAELNPETFLLLYFVPMPAGGLPLPGSRAAQWLESCKARYQALAASRPHTALLDRMVEDDLTRDVENFDDTGHVRNATAPVLERDIAAALHPLIAAHANGSPDAQQ